MKIFLGLVFVTYPETIAKFKYYPQVFSVMFFLMLYILALGSILAITSSAVTVIQDQFKSVKNWQAALGFAIYGSIAGIIYTTPGGQAMLNLIDHYCATFVIFVLAVLELYTFCYIYGVNRICDDVKFMLGFRPNIFWRTCWKYITPTIMTAIVIYALANYKDPTDNGKAYPPYAHAIGWIIATLGLIWVPLMFVLRVIKQKEITVIDVSF
jgi:solute carrier family 6 amino acid transporter-like protein 5/7/9/14